MIAHTLVRELAAHSLVAELADGLGRLAQECAEAQLVNIFAGRLAKADALELVLAAVQALARAVVQAVVGAHALANAKALVQAISATRLAGLAV
jgi:hypothetical protein